MALLGEIFASNLEEFTNRGANKQLATPGTDAYSQAVQTDNAVYDSVFKGDALSLRDIGLGVTGTASDQTKAAKDAIGDAATRFDVGASGLARAQRGLGVTADASTQKSQSRRMGLARVLAQVDAGNKASRNALQTQKEAQSFGTQFWGSNSTSANSMLASIAQAETSRNAQYSAAQDSAKAAEVSLAGSLLSMI